MKNEPEMLSQDDFERMLNESFTTMTKFKPGQAVETQVLSISKDTIFLQANGKSEGVLAKSELTDDEGNVTVQVGDKLKVYFLQSANGEMVFTTKLKNEALEPEMVEQAFINQIPIEGLVEKEIKGGYEVKIGSARAFCPYSQMGSRRNDGQKTFVGTTQTFRVTEYKERGRKILVSNRVFHEEAHQKNLEELKKTLKLDGVVKGTVASIQSYGAFVDIGFGVQALLPGSEIGRSRVEDIKSVLQVGQEIEAQVIKLDWDNEKISLSMKNLQADPWDQAKQKYPEGSKHQGKVVRILDFGTFVNLESGIDGLLHVSELKDSDKYANTKAFKIGQVLSVQILGVDQKAKRISLKLATSAEEDAVNSSYLSTTSEQETYNPFAALLNKKK